MRRITSSACFSCAALTASALAGYEHLVFPFPPNLAPGGFITFDAQEVYPQLTVSYLLLDFGGVVVHVFTENARHFYDLERLWRAARRVKFGNPHEGSSLTGAAEAEG